MPDSDAVAESALAFSGMLAGRGLVPSHAKLYSQFTRVLSGQGGLTSWSTSEADERLSEAVRLLNASLITRERDQESWKPGALRAAELFEWLAPSALTPDHCPARFLAAAVYQLAGYPARAAGMFSRPGTNEADSRILEALLKADFPLMMQGLAANWSSRTADSARQAAPGLGWDPTESQRGFADWLVEETTRSLGVLVSELRWGRDDRLEPALSNLNSIAKMLLHGTDDYGWLLAKVCAELGRTYVDSSLRRQIEPLRDGLGATGAAVLERYLRRSFLNRRALAWPAQSRGIAKLRGGESFALCTPTGSGKTAVAELAIIQALFREPATDAGFDDERPLALYLTPSRALAAEVEARLASVLGDQMTAPVVVTGLYGGTDWGPTDAWLTAQDRAVLICTYEKAEALVRFLGPLFLGRVKVVIIDEAHQVQLAGDSLVAAIDSRALSLESLVMRLASYLGERGSRVIALSAVAVGVENVIAQWVSGNAEATATRVSYRSTRQLIGRLEYKKRQFQIRYDLLDSRPLRFREGNVDDTPYIPRPFKDQPVALDWDTLTQPEKQLRPAVLWSAMQLAAGDTEAPRAVLVFIGQHPEWYAKDFLTLLDETWQHENLPKFFSPPQEATAKRLWDNCVETCADYFGTQSYEYRLLQKGIVLHHGKMPGRMARLLVEVVAMRVVSIVVATSTLSEGVNLPFEVAILPSLSRGPKPLDVREFANLVGRAGRPGSGTEGRALVVFGEGDTRKRRIYQGLIQELAAGGQDVPMSYSARSPLATLLTYLETQWSLVSGFNDSRAFRVWLETTAPLEIGDSSPFREAARGLDSLDKILLAAVSENESVVGREMSATELEERLQEQWSRSYAHFAAAEEARLGKLFVARGQALVSRVYPDGRTRKRLYMTSLSPKSASRMLDAYPSIKELLATGNGYADWDADRRFEFVVACAGRIASLPGFELAERVPGRDWHLVLRWWLDRSNGPRPANEGDVFKWYDYVSKNFVYKFCWGFGSILALAMDEAHNGVLRSMSLEEWPTTGLPWAVFWMKELVTWGTLDPIAAYLLSLRVALTRTDAEARAQGYYDTMRANGVVGDELLSVLRIRDWASPLIVSRQREDVQEAPSSIKAVLLRDFTGEEKHPWRVVPVTQGPDLIWFDVAGFALAKSACPEGWSSSLANSHDFNLDADELVVRSQPYA